MRVFLGLGSNMGDKHKNLALGCELINALNKMDMINLSSIYETYPLYNSQQPFFKYGNRNRYSVFPS